MKEIVLASGNPGKLKEISAILDGLGAVLRSQADFDVVPCEETGLSFVENAILKAQNAARQTGLPAIADDSGIAVDALDGAPGVYSARYAGVDASDAENLHKLIADFSKTGGQNPACRFICLVVYVAHEKDPLPQIFQGIWEGQLLTTPQGENGFGYDPIFWLPEYQCTSAQLSPEQKNRVSHRGQALAQLSSQLELR